MQREVLQNLAAAIRANPAFPGAARRSVSEFVEWRKQLGVNNRLISNVGRESIVEHLLMLHFSRREGDLESGATFERLAARCEAIERVGARAVRTALRLLQIGGFVAVTRDRQDRRLRVFQPTPALLAHAREYYAIVFGVIEELAPESRVRSRLIEEPDYLIEVLQRAGQAFYSETFAPRPQLLRREGASAVVAFVVDCHWRRGRLPTPAQLARLFQISGSQVRVILKAAADSGLIVPGPRGRVLDASRLADEYLAHYSLYLAFFVRYGFELHDRLTGEPANSAAD